METTINDSTQNWIPILDYAVMKGVSTSTLRRYIKSNKIKYKVENGRYLLLANETVAPRNRGYADQRWEQVTSSESNSLFNRVRDLEERLMRAQEQIGELKMLVAIYEEQLAQQPQRNV